MRIPLAISNILLFQLGWFACVLGAAYGMAGPGSILALIIISIHLYRSSVFLPETVLVFSAVLIGTLWDSLLVWNNIIEYRAGIWVNGMAPYWIIALWGLFATTLNVSLNWMKGRWLIAIISGALSGPLAYFAGFRLGAVQFHNFELAMLVLAVGWGTFVPLLLYLAEKLNGYRHLDSAKVWTS